MKLITLPPPLRAITTHIEKWVTIDVSVIGFILFWVGTHIQSTSLESSGAGLMGIGIFTTLIFINRIIK